MGLDIKELELLRRRLDQLEYREHFSEDSAELVYRLFGDLVKGTETCRSLKSQVEQSTRDSRQAVQQLEPLKVELARFTGENNQLHLDLIHALDDKEAQQARFDLILRNHQKQISDLKFVLTQYKLKTTDEQKKVAQERSKVAELFAKQGLLEKPLAHKLRDGADFNVPKLQKIDLETGLEPMQIGAVPVKLSQPTPLEADLVRLAEARSEMLDKQVKALQSTQSALENDLALLRNQVSQRDSEIKRLGTQLEVARSQQFAVARQEPLQKYEPITVKSGGSEEEDKAFQAQTELPQAQVRIQQLETHVEYLQEHIGDLESEAATFDRERRRLKAHISKEQQHLEEELQRERARNATLVKNLNKLEKLVSDLQRLAAAKDNAAKSKIEAATNLTADKKEKGQLVVLKSRILGLTEQLQAAKGKLSQSVADLERLLEENKSLREDLGQAKGSVENLNSQLRTIAQQLAEPATEAGSGEVAQSAATLEKENWMLKKSAQLLQEQLNKYTGAQPLDVESLQTAKLRKSLNELENQLSQARAEKTQLAAKVASLERECSFGKGVQEALGQANREKEAAERSLVSLEGQFANLKNQVNVLELEKTKLRAQLEQAESIKAQTSEHVSILETQMYALTDKMNSLNEILNKRESYIAHLESLADSVTQKTSKATQNPRQESAAQTAKVVEFDSAERGQVLKELAAEKEQLAHIKTVLRETEHERDYYREEFELKRSEIDALKSKVEKLNLELGEASERLGRNERELGMLNAQLEDAGRSNAGTEKELELARGELVQVTSDNQQLAEQVRNVAVDIASLTKENQALNQELCTVASQRDGLRANLQDAENRINYLDQVIAGKEEERSQLMTNYRKVIAESEYAKTDLRVADESNQQLKMQSIVLERRTREAEGRMHEAESIAQQLRVDLKNLEAQYSAVSRSLAASQRAAQQLEKDQRRAMKDVEAAKDLTYSLDKSKEELLARNVELEVEVSRLQRQIEVDRLNFDRAQADYESSKTQIERLELLLAQTRESQRVLELELEQFRAHEAQHKLVEFEKQELEETQRIESEMTQRAARRAIQLETRVESLEKDLQLAQLHLKERKNELEATRERSLKMQQQLYDLQELLSSKELLIQKLLRKDEAVLEADSVEIQVNDARQRLLKEWKLTQQQLRDLDKQESKSSTYKPAFQQPLLEDSIFYNYSKTPILQSDSEGSSISIVT